MNKNDYWQLFLETGAPEAYLMYKGAQWEGKDVSDDQSNRPAGNGLQ